MREDQFRRGFGRRVRAARDAKKLTQRELAERAEIADRYLSRIEGGTVMPSVWVAFRIARALGVGLDTLTDLKAKPERASMTEASRLLADRSDGELERIARVIRAMTE